MSAQPTIHEVFESYSNIVSAEMDRGVMFARERISGVSWENIALAADTSIRDVTASAKRAFWGVEPTPA